MTGTPLLFSDDGPTLTFDRDVNGQRISMGGKGVFIFLGGLGIVLGVFIIEYESGQDLTEVRSIALTTLILFEILRAYNCKSSKPFQNLLSNKWLHMAALVSITMHIALLYVPFLSHAFDVVPLTALDWLQSIGMAVACFVVLEFSKLFIKNGNEFI